MTSHISDDFFTHFGLKYFHCRPHDYRYGYYNNGTVHIKPCPDCVYKHPQPICEGFYVKPVCLGFHVYVKVQGNSSALISTSEGDVMQVNPHYNVTPRFGVMVANGRNTFIQAWDFYINDTIID